MTTPRELVEFAKLHLGEGGEDNAKIAAVYALVAIAEVLADAHHVAGRSLSVTPCTR